MIYDKLALSAGCIFARTCDILKVKRDSAISILLSGVSEEQRTAVMDSSLHISILVNSAFACELFLKAQLPPEVIPKNRQGHDLEFLFSLLNSKHQQLVIQDVIQQLQKHLPDYNELQFQTDLHNHCDVFTKWRYFYEGDTKPAGDFILCLMRALLNTQDSELVSVQ